MSLKCEPSSEPLHMEFVVREKDSPRKRKLADSDYKTRHRSARSRETGSLLPNNKSQHRTLHI